MNYIFRIAIGIFTLSACLNMHPVTRRVAIHPMTHIIHLLWNSTSCQGNPTFYTPTNVKVECITDGLQCFKLELDVVKNECSTSDFRINQTRTNLDKLIEERKEKGHTLTNSTSCACESSPQKPLHAFLDEMISLAGLHGSSIRANAS